MLKKVIGITILAGVVGLLAFGAITRTTAKNEQTRSAGSSTEERGGYGYGRQAEITAGAYGQTIEQANGQTIDRSSELALLPTGELDTAEEDALIFMREEEKLAHDVYVFLYEKWGLSIFQNIASSEQSHTEAVATLFERYGIDDPASSVMGEFTNPDLQALYNKLIVQGSESLADALKVGAAIEEIDILDLQAQISATDNADILQVYNNLLNGSYNHLRSFTSTLLRQTGETYEPQYLSVSAYQTILEGMAGNGGQGQNRGGRGKGCL
jgi:hypothetical protein